MRYYYHRFAPGLSAVVSDHGWFVIMHGDGGPISQDREDWDIIIEAEINETPDLAIRFVKNPADNIYPRKFSTVQRRLLTWWNQHPELQVSRDERDG